MSFFSVRTEKSKFHSAHFSVPLNSIKKNCGKNFQIENVSREIRCACKLCSKWKFQRLQKAVFRSGISDSAIDAKSWPIVRFNSINLTPIQSGRLVCARGL